MELPNSSQPCLARIDFGAGNVNIVSANSTPTIQSVVDMVSGQAALQNTVANQPTLLRQIQRVPSFYDAGVFNGTSQVLAFDTLAPLVATMNSFTVFVSFKVNTAATANQTLFSFGRVGADGYTSLMVSGSAVLVADKNDAATITTATGGTVDTNIHWAALSSANGTLTAYLDSATAVASASVGGAHTYGTCSIGALRNNGTTNNYFGGNIYEVAVFKGLADMTAIATYMTAWYEPYKGLHRTY